MVQMHAFYVFLGVAGLLAAAFLYVALSTRHLAARDPVRATRRGGVASRTVP